MSQEAKSDLEKRIATLNERADKVSEKIRRAEALLQEVPLSRNSENVTFLSLSWDTEKRRIMMFEKPFIEHKISERLRAEDYIGCLVDAVIMKAESLFEAKESV